MYYKEKTEKICSGCFDELPATTEFFPPSKQNADGLYPYCRKCKSIKATEQRKLKALEKGKKFTMRDSKYRSDKE
jgi:hypothetical protein